MSPRLRPKAYLSMTGCARFYSSVPLLGWDHFLRTNLACGNWCFLDRATPNTDTTLRRLEAALDSAFVPAIWRVEVANALGKGVVRRKMTLRRAQEIWEEMTRLPIRQSALPLCITA